MARRLASLLRGRWGTVTLAPLALCCLAFCLPSAGSHDLKISDAETIKVLVNENITIPCRFVSLVWDLRIIGINWYYRQKDGEKIIYQFDGARGVHIATRPGSTMLIEEIKKGNGALHLPRIQINEEGEYKCVVHVTPSKAERRFLLQVSAQPISSLLPKEVEVQVGTEKSVSCRMEGFYPQAFEISWWTSKYGVISEDTCTGDPEKNQDGTYTVTSYLRLQPSMQDDKNIYMCIVQHRSLSGPLMLNTTLTVKDKYTSLSVFIEAVIGTTLVWILIVVCSHCVHKRYMNNVAPKVSEIIGNDVLVHMEKATLSCQITGFCPEEITVKFSFSHPEKTSTGFYLWPSRRHSDGNDMEATAPLWDNLEMAEHLGSITGQADIKSHSDGTYSLSCRIIIVPDADEHHGAELCLTIKHKTSEEPVHLTRRLSVIRRPPKVYEIIEPPRIIHQESITLTCPINGFKQSPLKIRWIKKNQSKEEELVEYDSSEDVKYFSEKYSHSTSETFFSDGTFNILSALSFAPSITADDEAEFLCRILHYATKAKDEKTLTLCVKAQPTLDPIEAVPEPHCIEEKLTLSCRIHSFFPQTLDVKWYKNDADVLENISISDITRGPDGLCSCTTTIEFTPCKKDIGMAFICRVGHESLKNHKGFVKHKEAKWILQRLMRSPKSLEIVCEPEVPKEGESVTLSCVVKDYYPLECEVRWFRGFQSFQAVIVEAPQLCKETDLYHRKSQLTFTPTKDDHNAEFTVEVIHCGRQLRRTFPLLLKGYPIVKDIMVDPNEVMYGKPVALSCQVMGCDPEDLTVTWFQKGDQILNGLSSRMPPPNIKDHSIKYFFLDLITTAFHYNKEFMCKVKHKNLQQSIDKQMYLPLKPQPPVLSDIIMTPAEPDTTNNLHMSINVSDFAPKEIHIKWYNSWTEFPKGMVTCSEPQIGANFLYCASSQAEFKPDPSGKDIKIRCEVTHSSTNTVLEKIVQFNFKGFPIVKDIMVDPHEVMYGKPVALSCQVMGCDPKDLTVTWFHDGDQILNGLSSRMPPTNIKDHSIKYFFLDLIPTAFHYNKKFICKVKHKNMQQSIDKQMYLPLKPQPPVLSDITMKPAVPDTTKSLRLSIKVSDFAPKEIHINWYNSKTEFSKEMVTCSEPHVGANALYCASSQAEFKPELSNKDILIRCEVTHSGTNTVLEKIVQFNFKGSPSSLVIDEDVSVQYCPSIPMSTFCSATLAP